MQSTQRVAQHVGHVIDVVERKTHIGPDPSAERLMRSWQRSLNTHQVDPSRINVPRVVTSRELREHRERLEAFMRISREGIDRLQAQIVPANYCVLLTDAEGVTIDYRTVPALEREFREQGFRPGTCWSEAYEGTCGVGTSLIDGQPTLVHRDEHFRTHNIAFTCSSAPIFGPDDQPLAILDASALYSPAQRDSQHLVFRMVIERAQQIENAFAYYHLRPYWVLQCGRLAEFLSVQADYLIGFDESGRIMGGNRRARMELFSRDDAAPPQFIHDLFDCTARDILATAHGRPGQAIPLRMQGASARLFANLHPPAMHTRVAAQRRTGHADQQATSGTTPLRGFSHLAIEDARLRDNVERALKIANRNIPVMLLGDTGTGKEAFAHAVHDFSERRDKPFVALNCAAIPENLIESELFGYRHGAFTGARNKGARGKIAQADGGTLFLDEIGDMPLQLQCRLLRVLAEGEVLPLGAETPIPVTLHIICATHQNLPELVRDRHFREDLYYRLNAAVFQLPPLRERTDISRVIEWVLRDESAAMGREAQQLDSEARRVLEQYAWPGNIRQLRHAMRYACAVADGNALRPEHLPPEILAAQNDSGLRRESTPLNPLHAPSPLPLPPAPHVPLSLSDADAVLRASMIETLRRNQWQVKRSAHELDMSRATFYRKLKKLQIVSPNRRDSAS